MPARDIYHNNVKNALIKDGWTITHDPLRLSWGGKEPNRMLYLAVPKDILRDIFREPLGQLLLKHNLVQIIGFDPQAEVIVEWIP